MALAVGTKTPYTLDATVDQASYTWSHTRAAGAAVHVIGIYRSTGNPSPTVTSVTFGGTAMTVQAQSKVDGSGKIGVFVATLDAGVGPTGAQTIVVSMSASKSRDFAGYAADILDTAGAAGGAANAVSDAGATSISASYTPSVAGELMLALGGCRDGSGNPTAGSGWTDEGTVQSAADANAVEVRMQSKAASGTSAQTADVTLAVSLTDRAIAVVGWKPKPRGAMMMAA